ncbi:RHS repeat-associated core domain-containing protein [Criblamydia sequanensis]|uniref:Rhs family protein n=1 Tax=Candidatus Criblamydia sequanensis CRIB-18 TaxID=1437425 RepID=A0A090CZF1_9BACT|nr:RHS repeat-associated core domain-containing protein [Criblamydia sequanensis]CDR34447.1 Rhs family protein [Criblamydia sequanensis CRIB-18]
MKKFICFLLVLTNISLFSENENDLIQQHSLINYEGLPSAIVAGCVNTVSGDFFESSTDIIIPGIEPFHIERNYSSSNYYLGAACWGWNFNHHGVVCEKQNLPGNTGIRDKYKTSLLIRSGEGAILDYESPTDQNLKIDPAMWKKGLTNSSGGTPSGKTNLGNHLCSFNEGWVLKTGAGETFEYKYNKHHCFYLSAYRKPNNFKYIYNYDNNVNISQVTLVSPKNEHLASLDFHFQKSGTNIFLPSGKKVRWNYTRLTNGGNKECAFISSVESDFALKIDYKYENYETLSGYKVHRIVEKSHSANQFTKINYYKEKKRDSNNLYNHNYAKVKEVIRPLGLMGEPCALYTFHYGFDKVLHNGVCDGLTTVKDALGRKNIYRYNNSHLEKIEQYKGFSGEYSLYRKKIMNFAKHGSFYAEGHLVGYGVIDDNNFGKVFTQYTYDNVGNVTKIKLYGNLTGSNFMPVEFDFYNIPTMNGVEIYEKSYIYSDDGLNNVLEEDDGKKKTCFSYYPGSSNCKAKYMIADGKIIERFFYEYDENGFLIKEVKDDGSSQDLESLTEVTERHIKLVHPTQIYPKGLPKEIIHYVYDFSLNQEVQQKKIVNTYSPDGFLTQEDVFDKEGNFAFSKKWEYDSRGRLISEIDAMGSSITYEYDNFNNLISKKGPLTENEIYYTYDHCNRLVKEELYFEPGNSLSRNYFYDKCSQKIGETDHFGNRTDFTYDEFGRLIKTELPEIPDIHGNLSRPTTRVEYDVLDAVNRTVDAIGGEKKTESNVRGKPYHQINPDGTEERNEYALDGTLIKSVDHLGNTYTFEHDYLGRIIKTTFSDCFGNKLKETSHKYNAFHLMSETDALGVETKYEYDFAGKIISKQKNLFKELYEYDALDRLHKIITYQNEIEAICQIKEYDLLDRVIEERTEALDGEDVLKKQFVYDALGRKIKDIQFGENGEEIIETTYNAFNEIVEIKTADGNKTKTFYNYNYQNAYGQHVLLVEIVDANGHIHRIEKNTLGQDAVLDRCNALNEVLYRNEYFYDGLGNVVKNIETSFLGDKSKTNITERQYDSAGRLISILESTQSNKKVKTEVIFNEKGLKEAVLKPSGLSFIYLYDDLGRSKEIRSSDGTIHTAFEYDLLDNPIRIVDLLNNSTTYREFDQENRLVKETLGNGLSTKYSYDYLGRITSLNLPDNSSVDYEYNAGQLSKITRCNSNHRQRYQYHVDKYDLSGRLIKESQPHLTLSYKYDKMGRLESTRSDNWSEELTYDRAGNIIQKETQIENSTYQENFSYDELYQLTEEKGSFTNTYKYDAFNNRLQKNDELYEINELNQIESKGDNSSYKYDLDGNLIYQMKGNDTFTYAYDALGRLTSYKNNQIEASYSYDPFNRRLSKTVKDSNGNIHYEKYLYCFDNEIGSFNSKGEISSFRVLKNPAAEDYKSTLAIEFESGFYATINDHKGCISYLVEMETGELASNIQYDAYGNQKILSSNIKCLPWGYSNKRLDLESGLIFFGRRYYDPEEGRWITKDPLGDYDGPNLYAYVKNQPLTIFDAYGYFGEYYFNNIDFLTDISQDYPSNSIMKMDCFTKAMNEAGPNNLVFLDYESILFEESKKPGMGYINSNGTFSREDSIEGISFKDRAITFINGINNTHADFMNTLDYLKECCEGYCISGVYNNCHGTILNLFECRLNTEYVETNPSKKLREHWDKRFDEIGPKGFILHYCHSQGAIHTRNALMSYPDELRKRIIVIAIAPAAFIDIKNCCYVQHYVSNDLVPNNDTPGYDMACRQGTVMELKSPWLIPVDHSFNSPTYWSAIKGAFRQFKSR